MCLGIPGQIVEIVDAEKKLGKADVSGVRRVINLACIVDEDTPIESTLGQWVLIHVGFAMGKIDEEEAARTLSLLQELGEAQREVEEMRRRQEEEEKEEAKEETKEETKGSAESKLRP